ncbi:S-methyl-5-thioribose-1-phosphate isomerase [Polycyclovorans algicola]|uniref:S-methyl-5-thioribose-1-phosphate isomerase n=1 Tax=Polycyclovorans algicola TaxID=616992 RepID=UPI0004A72C04|nr:S-methyl-5-thioribose-1-phosphate isomerase [Polycyclovorans algicola]
MTLTPAAVQPIQWRGDALELLDQRVLPAKTDFVRCTSAAEVAQAIHDMVVRGAPAIGIAAAYGLVLDARAGRSVVAAAKVLAAARPTAVNLHWALSRMTGLGADSALRLETEANAIFDEDLRQNHRMAALGAALIEPGSRVLTHCNTGALATAGHGTALGVIRTAWKEGRLAEVFHTETRPWLQGARLTAWELQQDNIPCRMIADAAVAQLMQTVKIDWVIVGADRIAANGDTANKIGTATLAIVARHFGAKVMVVAPSGTFDLETAAGAAIPIESRADDELTRFRGEAVAPDGHRAFNPVFDVTPAGLIDAIVCEKGVLRAPFGEAIRAQLG